MPKITIGTQQSAALQAKQELGDLSLSDLRLVSQKVGALAREALSQRSESSAALTNRVTLLKNYSEQADKLASIAGRVLSLHKADHPELKNRDVSLLPTLGKLDMKVMQLFLEQHEMDPDVLAEELTHLSKEVEGLERQEPTSQEVQGRLHEVKEKVKDLIFSFVFPIVHELKPNPGTFADELTRGSHAG